MMVVGDGFVDRDCAVLTIDRGSHMFAAFYLSSFICILLSPPVL